MQCKKEHRVLECFQGINCCILSDTLPSNFELKILFLAFRCLWGVLRKNFCCILVSILISKSYLAPDIVNALRQNSV